MSIGYINLIVFLLVLTLLAMPLGRYIALVFDNKVNYFAWLEKPIYKLLAIDPNYEMTWLRYAIAVMLFSIVGIVVLFLMLLFQQLLPLNPEKFSGLNWDLALNTAISFVTNTNWQAYSGESTMSYFNQMVGLSFHNFVSAATGIAVLVAFIRGFTRVNCKTIGNFWSDLVKSTLYILLPLSFILAIILVSQGVPQNFSKYKDVQLLEKEQVTQVVNNKTLNQQLTTQTLPMGPIASQEAIKMLGTNGGGYFGANSAHPYENPTPISNFLEILALLLIPASLCFTFGKMVKDNTQGHALYIAMTIIFIVLTLLVMGAELRGNPLFNQFHVSQVMNSLQSGGNMEGKEVRFGIFGSGLFAAATTAASCGAVNAAHDSLLPMGGFVPLFLMLLSEVVFGGVGSGLYGMLAMAILAVFISGLMIGRTPEYLGKKIESFDMKMVSIIILIVPLLVLFGTAISLIIPAGLASIFNPKAHGLSEVLYAFTSAVNNNGSAFAGLNGNTVYYNMMLSVAMFFGRFGIIIPLLALAGNLANKKHIPESSGTMPTNGILFICILIGVIIIIGALTYIPALALGPIVEHLQLFR
ncbi:MAG: potassium-transporting ATPase subunit KdpA [Bacteroidia bacterium]|nr:MAG: potassium-transporting ATPase subunit KdpA [Bacteroidia bacterium]